MPVAPGAPIVWRAGVRRGDEAVARRALEALVVRELRQRERRAVPSRRRRSRSVTAPFWPTLTVDRRRDRDLRVGAAGRLADDVVALLVSRGRR